MGDVDIHALAEDARRLGYTSREQVINRLTRRIVRDQSYLERRKSRGTHTSHDDTTAEDAVVLALAIEMLQEQIGGFTHG